MLKERIEQFKKSQDSVWESIKAKDKINDLTLAERLILEKESKHLYNARFTVSFTPDENRRLEVLARLVGKKKATLVSLAALSLCDELEEELGFKDTRGQEYHDLLCNKELSVSDVVNKLGVDQEDDE